MKDMKRLFYALLALIHAIFRIAIPLLIGVLLACFFCNIFDNEAYSWLSGIWHGIFFVPNYLRHLTDSDVLYKATNYTFMYNIYWWICSIISVATALPYALFVLFAPIVAFTTPEEDL